MLISLGINLEKHDKHLTKVNTHIHGSMVSKNNILKEFNNIEYIKSQSNDILLTVGKIKNLTTNQSIFEIVNLLQKDTINLERKYEEIRQLFRRS